MRKSHLFLIGLLMISSFAWSQEEPFVRPVPSKEVKQLISEAREAFSIDSQDGIVKLKDLISDCENHEDDSINFLMANFELGIFYYRLSEMDSAIHSFRICQNTAEKQNDHYFYYKGYLGLARTYAYLGEYDSARFYAEEALEHSEIVHFNSGIANMYNMLGVLAGHRGERVVATNYRLKSFEHATAHKDTLGIFLSSYNLATYLLDGGEYKKSIEYGIHAQQIAKIKGKSYQYAFANSALFEIYYKLKDYETALKYIKLASKAHLKALEDSEEEAHMEWVAAADLEIGGVYINLDSTKKARKYLKRAILYFDSTSRIQKRATAYSDYSKSYRNEGNYDSALHYALIAKDLGDASKHIFERMEGNLELARVYYALSNNERAKHHASIVLELADSNGSFSYVKGAASILYQIYDHNNNSDKALSFLKKFSAARDTLENENSIKSATSLTMQFEFDKERQVLEFEKEKEALLLNQQIQKEKTIQYGAFAGVLLLSIAVFGFYRSYKNKKRDHLKITEQASELQKTNDQLSELSRYKEGLSNMIVHDMKNPLNVILGLTNEKTPDREDTRFINQSGKMILQLTNNIMDIQKFEEAKMQLEKNVVFLHEIIAHSQQQVELLMKSKNMSFENDFSIDLTLYADIGIMSRILVNLFTNAIKYSPTGSILKVQASETGSEIVELTVTDSGQGIESSQLPYVFDKFWQVYAKKSGQTYSTGLGLTFCKLAIEAHEGTISVESIVDRGTTFTLSIPRGNPEFKPVNLEENTTYPAVFESKPYSEKDLSELLPVMEEISEFPLYKAGEIDKVLSKVTSESPVVNEWVSNVKQAVFSWDQQRFDQLVRSGENAIPPTGTD